MRPSLACELVEFRPQQWFLFLEGRDTGQDDWRLDATCTGPFASEALICAYMRLKSGMPSMTETIEFDPARPEPIDSPLGQKVSQALAVSPSVLAELSARVNDPEREGRQQAFHVAAVVARHERTPRRRFP